MKSDFFGSGLKSRYMLVRVIYTKRKLLTFSRPRKSHLIWPISAVLPLKPAWFCIIISNRTRKIWYSALTTTHKWLTVEVFSWPNHQFTSSLKIMNFKVIVAKMTKNMWQMIHFIGVNGYYMAHISYMNQVSECDSILVWHKEMGNFGSLCAMI